MPKLITQWICLGENPETLFETEFTLPDNSMYALAAPTNPPPGLGSAGPNSSYKFTFWNVNGNLILSDTVLIPLGTESITATAWYHLHSNIDGYSYACSGTWFSLGQDRPYFNEDSEGWQSPIATVDGQQWGSEPALDTDDGPHDIVLKQSIGNEWFHSMLLLSGTAVVNGLNIHTNQNAKNVWVLAFYETFGQAQSQNLKEVLARIRLPWKGLDAPARRDVLQLSNVIKLARRPGPVSPAVLRELSSCIKRMGANNLKKRLAELEETVFLLEAAQFLSRRALDRRSK